MGPSLLTVSGYGIGHCLSVARGTVRTPIVVQCDQTSFLATSMMLLSEEAKRPLQRPVQLPLTSEVQHGNRIDYSRSAVFARWRRVGILPLARLAVIAG
jgi:hypothetical protein